MITCAITGSNGVLGKRLKKLLPYKFYEFKKDIRNKKSVEDWVLKKKFDIVIHLAALVAVDKVNKDSKKAYDVNVKGTLNLINSIIKKKNKPKWFFFASTSHVYKPTAKFKKISEKVLPNPQNKYGKTKMIAENFLKKKMKKYPIKICIGRIFSFTDRMQKPPYLIPNILKKIKSASSKIELKNLNHYRDFLSTADIISAIDILRKKKVSGTYNIGSGLDFDLRDIAKLLSKKYNKDIAFKDLKKSSFLISNNEKIKHLKWKPNKFNNKINYFYK
jgi:nucleoside-diphosphate-sugar epimerase